MPKFDGFDEALKIVQVLKGKERENLLEQMSKQDPDLVEKLKKAMVQFKDLVYLTPAMMPEFLKDVELDDLGLALRAADQKLIDHLLSMVSSNNRKDIEDILKGKPQPVSKVQEAQDKIMDTVRAKVETGKIVLDRSGSETYV